MKTYKITEDQLNQLSNILSDIDKIPIMLNDSVKVNKLVLWCQEILCDVSFAKTIPTKNTTYKKERSKNGR